LTWLYKAGKKLLISTALCKSAHQSSELLSLSQPFIDTVELRLVQAAGSDR
jgi:hypothetical protein